MSARFRQCYLLQFALKILHLAVPKENGRDTDNTQGCSPAGKEQGPAKALWFEEKCLCLPDTWRGMLWGALWPLLLCVCINAHHSCSMIIISNTRSLRWKKNPKTHRSLLVTSQCSVADAVHWQCTNIKKWRILPGLGLSSAENE